jgi:hypothetical protein
MLLSLTFESMKKLKKRSTHLRHFPEFADLRQKVDEGLLYFAQTPKEITCLMGKYCTLPGNDGGIANPESLSVCL